MGPERRGGLCFALYFHSAPSVAASEECCPAELCLTSRSKPGTKLKHKHSECDKSQMKTSVAKTLGGRQVIIIILII